jgi:hypothetical protein
MNTLNTLFPRANFVGPQSIARCYVSTADKFQVMEEQFWFLVDHLKEHATFTPGCRECGRLALMENLLLSPFNETAARRAGR